MRWRRGRLTLTLVAALAATLPTFTAASGQAALRDEGVSRAGGHAIDTSDKQAVAKAYRTRWLPNQAKPTGWTGSTAKCRAGKPSKTAHRAVLESVNFARAMAGLDKVKLNDKLNRKAQKAALIMAANRALSHYPPPSWRCWSKKGAAAAGASNLALAYPRMAAGGAIAQYLHDHGRYNKPVGHRRWVLYPGAESFGNGQTSTTNALYVFGASDETNANPDWVPWPTAGWFPSALQPHGRWSLASGDPDADFSDATVKVKRGSKRLGVEVYPFESGFGMPTLVFFVRKAGVPGRYQVKVSGIKGAASSVESYTVKLFKP